MTVKKDASDMNNSKRERSSEEMGKHADNKKAPKLDYSMNIEQMLEQETRREKRKRMEENQWVNEPTIELGIPRINALPLSDLASDASSCIQEGYDPLDRRIFSIA